MEYEAVIGMEIHAELDTESKLFCGCSTRFGAEPNTQTCPVCLGMPGVLPVMNQRAFDLAVKAALALDCQITLDLNFDRKNYYYPDLPKNFQISQLHRNIGVAGQVAVPTDDRLKCVGIWNVHLEEDAGKLIHSDTPGDNYSLVDLNRTGVPLLEIVSAPDMRSMDELEAYMKTVRNILLYVGVSDCKIQEGSLRFEPGVSVKPAEQDELGPRVEIKNVGSITMVLRSVEYEIHRQTRVLQEGGANRQETRLWNDALKRTEPMRTKESAQDYRYFPEPDLAPFRITDADLQRLSAEIPELPVARRERFIQDLGLSAYDAGVLTDDRPLAEYFEAVVAQGASAKSAANWVANSVNAALNEQRTSIEAFPIAPVRLGKLVRLIDDGKISVAAGREVFAEMMGSDKGPDAIVEEKGLSQISDASAIKGIVSKVVAGSPQIVADWKAGKKKALNALIGPVMRETRGKANPQVLRQLLQKALDEA